VEKKEMAFNELLFHQYGEYSSKNILEYSITKGVYLLKKKK
jgi:hypothetical protein